MAKIALLTKKITPEALGLAQALQFHRHEILMVTSADEHVPDNLGYQVLTYFKSWTAFEALKFFPRLLGQAPVVWHFVFTNSSDEKPTPAHWILSNLAHALPGAVVAASFYDSLLSFSPYQTLPLLKSCDIVTTATRENLMYLKRKSWLNRYCETEVLPPFVLSSNADQDSLVDQDLRQLIQAVSPYLVIPSERLPELEWESVLGKINLLVCGPRPARSPNGVYYVGHNLSESAFTEILRHSRGLITAFDDLSVVELLKYQRLCSVNSIATVASPRQTEDLPGFCVHKRNGFLIQDLSQLNHLLMENPHLEIPSPVFETIKTDLADSALNELNRLYSKVRHVKTSNIDFKRGPLP